MTIARLKQSMDRRFRSVDRRFQRLEQKMDRGFLDIRREMKETAVETRQHFDVVAESLHDDLRIFADGIARQTERLDQHDVRIDRLERRAL